MTCETYLELSPLREDRGKTLYRAVRAANRRPVLLQVLAPGRTRAEDVAELANELEIGTAVRGIAVVAPVVLTTFEGRPALELEYREGAPLAPVAGEPMPVEVFVGLAVALASVLADLHARGVIHKDLRPANILFNRQTSEVTLCGLGLARRVPAERSFARPLRLIEGSLPYVSPEQTGRLNRMIDARSDLYACGVVMYQLATGSLPFTAQDALGWVHCHVARRPSSPTEIVPTIPAMLSRIILRLLEKTPETRYQSAAGLLHDLRRCQAALRNAGHIAPFPVASHDVSDRFEVAQRLYGRERERALLLSCFEEVASSHGPGLALVGGPPGIGKSALVQELQQPIATRAGRFVAAKFDQHRRDVPYTAVVDALREMLLDVLAESAQEVAEWRERLTKAVGSNGALACDLIPQLRLILDTPADPPPVAPAEKEIRLRRVLARLVAAFASPKQPLTIFLDDVQWADAASAKLMAEVLLRGDTAHLLLVAAHREQELAPGHPLLAAAAEMAAGGGNVREVTLGPLSRSDLEDMVADAVRAPREQAAPLASIIAEKTAGNPFFVAHLLSAAHRQGLITFDPAQKRWRCDESGLRATPSSDNVIDLLVAKLRDLPPPVQEIIQIAACLGGTFAGDVVGLVLGREPGPVLQAAVAEDLLIRLGGSYRFPHDRLQEAAYALVPPDERPHLHLRIGRRLLGGHPSHALPAEVEARLFDVVHQLHLAIELVTSTKEREELAALDLRAGRRAQAAGAQAAARVHFAAGAALLGPDAPDRCYRLWFDLELGQAESDHLTGAPAAAEERLARLAPRARGLVDQTAVVCAQAAVALPNNHIVQGVELLLTHLRRFGIDWTLETTDAMIREEYDRLRTQMGNRTFESLYDLPPVDDLLEQAKLDSLVALTSAASMSNEKLMYLAAARLANLTIALGQSDAAPLAFVMVGQMLGPYFGDYPRGFAFAQVAVDLLELRKQTRFRAQVLLQAASFVYPWTQPVPRALDVLRRGQEAAAEAGEDMLVHGAREREATLLFLLSCDSLDELGEAVDRAVVYERKAHFGTLLEMTLSRAALLRGLRGLTPRLIGFDDAEVDEERAAARYEAYLGANTSLVVAEGWYWIRKLGAKVFACDYPAALAAARQAKERLWTTTFALERLEYHVFGALAVAGYHDDAPAPERAELHAALLEHARALDGWARDCPENFRACAALVHAEVARIDGAVDQALREYERAIASAHERGQTMFLALALEAASRFYRANGVILAGDTYLREARDVYARWGAAAKVQRMEADHPTLAPRRITSGADATVLTPEGLDLLAVIKASQAISGALVRDELLEMLLAVVLEHGGARRARLVLVRDDTGDGQLEVVAEKAVDDALTRLQPAPRVPDSLLEYVRRTEAPVVLEDALADAGRFANDPYFARGRPRSVVCLPIRRQRAVVGLLYLENELTPGAFTPDRLVALELLAAQAAVSLENAHLLGREREARQRAEADRQRALALGEATALLSSSPDQDGIARALRGFCARGLADWAVLDVIEGGSITHLVEVHRDEAREPLLRRLGERYPVRVAATLLSAPGPEETAPTHLPSLSDEQLRQRCEDGDHAALVREVGVRSLFVLPLVARGARLGVLSLGSASPYRFGEADVELGGELARRVAMALDNERLTALETKLRQSQKMEAIGRLAGGVAHDFNNLLSVILSYAELLEEKAGHEGETHEQLTEIRRAAARATDLTRQLLAFGRQQMLNPVVLDLNKVVSDMHNLLARLLGDEVELALRLSQTPMTVRADGGQIGQVLMNLTVNARDAMPHGGRLIIETGKVELDETERQGRPGTAAGPYALLSVADTGQGLDPQTQDRIFEPFFTTKEPGKGTGLGLATVLGIVQQSGGHISLDSRPGHGAIFRIYLPWAEPDRGDELSTDPTASGLDATTKTTGRGVPLAAAGETILLVEDDDQVRRATRTALERSGYAVVEASGPGDALLIFEQGQTAVDLLVTDIQMPRMTGVELTRRLRTTRPNLPSLLMSGYADGAIVHDALREAATSFLQKPVTPQALLRAVRQLLDADRNNGRVQKNGTHPDR